MLNSLSVLPVEIKSIIGEFIVLPECVKLIDKLTIENEKVFGCLYVVMRNGTIVSSGVCKSLRLRALDCAERLGWDIWEATPVIMATTERMPLAFDFIDDFEEGVDYRILSLDEVRKELG